MVNLELLRKFVMQFIPEGEQAMAQSSFESIKNNPIVAVNTAVFFQQQYLSHSDDNLATMAINGVLTGIALCYGQERHPEIQKFLENYLEAAARQRGENVIGFYQKKGLTR